MRELQDHLPGDPETAAGGTVRTFADDQVLLGSVLAEVGRSG